MIPYDKFGVVYDLIGHDRFSVRMADYTLDILGRLGCYPRDGLDLCCGTGSAIRVFADHGLTMSGLDRSGRMLASARKKLKGQHVQLYRQELPQFKITLPGRKSRTRVRQFELITCFFDSLNYLAGERQVRAAFKSVYRHLKPGGWLIFDMNTPHMLRTVFTDQNPYAGVKSEVAWIFRNRKVGTPDSADLLLTFFVKDGRHWRRLDEVHRERAYSNRVITSALRDAGLRVKAVYRCFSFEKPGRQARKVCFVARRPD